MDMTTQERAARARMAAIDRRLAEIDLQMAALATRGGEPLWQRLEDRGKAHHAASLLASAQDNIVAAAEGLTRDAAEPTMLCCSSCRCLFNDTVPRRFCDACS